MTAPIYYTKQQDYYIKLFVFSIIKLLFYIKTKNRIFLNDFFEYLRPIKL